MNLEITDEDRAAVVAMRQELSTAFIKRNMAKGVPRAKDIEAQHFAMFRSALLKEAADKAVKWQVKLCADDDWTCERCTECNQLRAAILQSSPADQGPERDKGPWYGPCKVTDPDQNGEYGVWSLDGRHCIAEGLTLGEAKSLQARISAQDEGKPESLPGNACPACGAYEIESNTPHTVYWCGSYDYDQRPGTFRQSDSCAAEVQRRLDEAKKGGDI